MKIVGIIRKVLNWLRSAIEEFTSEETSGGTPVTPPHNPTSPATDAYHVVMAEADGGKNGVDSGIDIGQGDFVSLQGSGSIWAGVFFTGENGPEGWDKIENNADFPLPGTRPFGLLYKIVEKGQTASLVPWQVLGTGDSFDWAGGNARLWFTINDDVPDNGSGQFDISVKVRRGS